MITLNKKYKISGTGPFDYTFTSNDPKISFEPRTGTTTSLVDVKVIVDSTQTDPLLNIVLTVKTPNGCVEVKTLTAANPCTTFATNSAIQFSVPDKFTLPTIIGKIGTMNWTVGTGLRIVSGQGTQSIVVEETGNSSLSIHQVLCEVTSPEGCKINLASSYSTCNTTLLPFSVASICGTTNIVVKSKPFLQKAHKTAEFDLKNKINNQVCPGCTLDYSSLAISGSTTAVVQTNSTGVVSVFDTSITSPTVFTYTIKDTCKKIYSGTFSVEATNCATGGGCYALPRLPDVHLPCSGVIVTADRPPTCGMATTPYQYKLVTDPINGGYNSNLFNWNEFKFLLPLQANGTAVPGYSLCNGGLSMLTPYGIAILNLSYQIEYYVTDKPDATANIEETFRYYIKDNTPAACISTVGLSTIIHQCLGKPSGTVIDDCATCFTTTEVPITLTLNGTFLDKIEVDSITPPNLGIANVIPDITTVGSPKFKIVVGGMTGDITFRYRPIGSTRGTTNSTQEGDWVSGNVIHVACAGQSSNVVQC